MNVIVMGSGGVGGYYGALLARAGHHVTFVARGPHLHAMQRDGLRVESAAEPAFTVPVHALPMPEPGLTADLVLLTVKTYDTEEAAERIRPAVGPQTTILTLQNGVDSGEWLAERFGAERVLDGVVYVESAIKAPGVIAQLGGPRRVFFGRRRRPATDADQRLLAVFQEAGWLAELSPRIESALWSKLVFIGPFAAVSTVTALPAGALRDDASCLGLIEQAMAEYAAVARAEGVRFDDDPVARAMDTLRGFPATGLSSMLRDRLAGKRLETAALVDTVVRRGGRLGAATPITHALGCLLAPMAAGGAAPARS